MNDQRPFEGRRTTLLLAALLLLGATGARAADVAVLPDATPPAAPACTVPAPARAAEAAGGAGMMAFIDPQTGRLTSAPTDEQRAEMRAALGDLAADSLEGLVAVRHADGRQSMNVKGRLMDFAIVRLEPTGKPAIRCADTVEQAVDLLVKPVAPTLDGLETQ